MTAKIALFTRLPAPGKAKTRMIPVLGAAGAAALQREMTAHALAWARASLDDTPTRLEVRFTGGAESDMRRCYGRASHYVPQGEGDLGMRMLAAFETAAREGITRTILIGSDCPGLDAGRLRTAIAKLADHDVVLGPARDGGYYLIGLGAPRPSLFEDIEWGSPSVLNVTLERARAAHLRVGLLDVLSDVDEPADLAVWREQRGRRPALAADATISVIVPTLDEAGRIGLLLEHLSTLSNAEIIVADGGSRDGTGLRVREFGAKLVTSSAGRAQQMNAGAVEAKGDILLFLHADTRLPDTFEQDIRSALHDPNVVAGAFRFALDATGRRFRALEWLVNWRSIRLSLPYGDQALFVRADVFRGLGGFPELAVMEDFEVVRRLKRRGRIVTVSTAARTSSRLWRRSGFVRVTLVNQLTILAHLAGMPADRLARWRRKLLARGSAPGHTGQSAGRTG